MRCCTGSFNFMVSVENKNFKKKIVNIGSLNKDIVVKVNNIPKPGETIMAQSSSEFLGGKGSNQAVAAAKVGGDVTMLGMVGDDRDGRWLLESLEKNNVITDSIVQVKSAVSGLAIVTVEDSAENTVVVIPGANHKVNIDYIKNNEEIIKNCDYVLLQMEVPKEVVEYSINHSKELGKCVILNPAPASHLNKDVLKNIDIITPNRSELSILTDMEVESMEDVKEASTRLIGNGVKKVIVTLGKEGAYYTDGSLEKFYNGIKVDSQDTTGAGDCFNGVLVASLAQNFSIHKSIKRAICASAISVTKLGAQNSMPNIEDLDEFMGSDKSRL